MLFSFFRFLVFIHVLSRIKRIKEHQKRKLKILCKLITWEERKFDIDDSHECVWELRSSDCEKVVGIKGYISKCWGITIFEGGQGDLITAQPIW